MSQGARGAEVLVAAADADVRTAARLAPAAVLVLVDATPDQVAAALDATLWAGHRVVGVRSSDVEGAVRAVAGEGTVSLRGVLRHGEADVVLSRSGVVVASARGST